MAILNEELYEEFATNVHKILKERERERRVKREEGRKKGVRMKERTMPRDKRRQL